MKKHNPDTVAAPISTYSHAIEIPPGARWLTVSGQVGIAPDGELGVDAKAQSEIVWQNIQRILESAGMAITDIVKMTAYLTDPTYVSGLVKPERKVEVEVQAARGD